MIILAEYSDLDCVNKVLTAEEVDSITILRDYNTYEVYNRAVVGGELLWFTKNGSDPEVDGDGCYPVPAGTSMEIGIVSDGPALIKVLGNANPYTVCGVG